MAEPLPSKQDMRVRFLSPAPFLGRLEVGRCALDAKTGVRVTPEEPASVTVIGKPVQSKPGRLQVRLLPLAPSPVAQMDKSGGVLCRAAGVRVSPGEPCEGGVVAARLVVAQSTQVRFLAPTPLV